MRYQQTIPAGRQVDVLRSGQPFLRFVGPVTVDQQLPDDAVVGGLVDVPARPRSQLTKDQLYRQVTQYISRYFDTLELLQLMDMKASLPSDSAARPLIADIENWKNTIQADYFQRVMTLEAGGAVALVSFAQHGAPPHTMRDVLFAANPALAASMQGEATS